MREAWKRIWTFVGLVLVLSAVCESIILLGTHSIGSGRGYYVQAIMWMPALAAFLTCRFRRKPFDELGFGWPNRKYILIAWRTSRSGSRRGVASTTKPSSTE